MANGWGGKRAGAGRKRKQTAIIREKALEEAGGDAQFALGLVIGFLRDPGRSPAFRRDCAVIVMDRVWGKPTQRKEISGEDGGPLVVQFVNDWRYKTPVSTSRPADDPSEPGAVQEGDGGPEVAEDDDGNTPGD